MLALGKKRAGEFWLGEKRPGRQGLGWNNLGDQAAVFGHMNLTHRRAPDPLPGLQ